MMNCRTEADEGGHGDDHRGEHQDGGVRQRFLLPAMRPKPMPAMASKAGP